MRDIGARFTSVMSAIDAVNAEDPNLVKIDGKKVAAELVCGHRMSEALDRMDPDASECLRIAARGQHIGRWRVAQLTRDDVIYVGNVGLFSGLEKLQRQSITQLPFDQFSFKASLACSLQQSDGLLGRLDQ